MSELIQSWLNDEVQLSKRIVDFEADFQNGFFFGELLSKFNQQLNFSEFANKDLRDVKLNNFRLLEPTFKTLGVRFDTQTVNKILQGKNQVAEKILYQLKMALEKVNNPADQLIYSKTGKYNTVTPLKKLKPPKEAYDKMESQFHSKRLNELNQPQKTTNLNAHLQKFKDFRHTQAIIVQNLDEKDAQAEKNLKDEMRKIQINKLQRNMAFMEDWNQKGMENWSKNQDTKRKREDADMKFTQRQDDKAKTLLTTKHDHQMVEMIDGIEQFENNLQKMGISKPLGDDELDDPDFKKEADNKSMVSANATLNRIKEKKKESDFMRKERDKRRRKMIVDQAKLQREIEVKKREELVLQKLEQQSRQEKEIEYEIWRAHQCKEIICEDRLLRDEKYKQKHELNVISAKYKEEEMLKVLRDENYLDIKQKQIRQQELEIQSRQDIRKETYQTAGGIIDQIISLAEICYDHQQTKDTQELDDRFYTEHIRSFIGGEKLIPCKQFRHYNIIENLKAQADNQELQPTKDFLAQKQLEDYINGVGQWQLTSEIEQPPEGEGYEEKYIPTSAVNNNYLGNIIEKILHEKYNNNDNKQETEIKTFDYIPVKMILKGYQFSGKKTLAGCLRKKYGVEILMIDNLISEIIDKYQAVVEWKESNERQALKSRQSAKSYKSQKSSQKSVKDQQKEVMQSMENQEQKPEEQPEITEKESSLAVELLSYLTSGQDIPDLLFIKVIKNKLDEFFPNKSEQEFLQEYKSLEMPPPIEEEKRMYSDMKGPPTKEEIFKKNLVNTKYKYTKGWILLDFPHTYDQAKLLDKELANYKAKDEIEKSEFEKQIQEAQKIAKHDEIKIIPRSYQKGAVNYCVNINISKEESLRRAVGRRYDELSKQVFHLEDNPPPCDNAPLLERLDNIRDFHTAELNIVDKNNDLDDAHPLLQEWFSMFGTVQDEKTIQMVDPADLQGKEEEQEKKDENIVIKDEQENDQQAEQQPVEEQVPSKPVSEKNLEKVEEQQDQPEEVKEEEKKEEEPVVEEPKGPVEVVQIVKHEIVTWQEVDGSQRVDEVFYKVDELLEKLLTVKELQYTQLAAKEEEEKQRKIQEEEDEKIRNENANKWLPVEHEEINTLCNKFNEQFKPSPEILENLVTLFDNVKNSYLHATTTVFNNVREQRELIQVRFHDIQLRFLELLQRPDNKFFYVRNYQEQYNQFVEENPDMCEEEETKEELHQRVEDLHNKLFDIIETKKEDAIAERENVMKTNYIETEMEGFLQYIANLVSAELYRSFGCIQLLTDYYTVINQGEQQDVPEYYKQEMIKNFEELPACEDETSYPRLQKIIDSAMKLFNGEVEEDHKDQKGGKGKPPPKKDDKKAGKDKKGAKEEHHEEKELTQAEQEMKKAINLEKAIFRYRVHVIKDMATNKLKEMRHNATELYNKLEDWLTYTTSIENNAVQEMAQIFRLAIEDQEKIQKEVQLNYVDVVTSHEILNFFTPPPIILHAREEQFPSRFTISQLYLIIPELKQLSNEANEIESKTLVQLFNRKITNKLACIDLPAIWENYTVYQFQHLVTVMDKNQVGYVNATDLCTYICLLNSPIATEIAIQNYRNQLEIFVDIETNYIDKQGFINSESWFDGPESSNLVEKDKISNVFERVRYIKELLFYIHRDPIEDLLNINSLLSSLVASKYIVSNQRDKLKNYNQLMFGK